jgi:hypothetical protein
MPQQQTQVDKSNMFPKLHPVNLKQLAAMLKHPKVKEAWFHANGNIYVDVKRRDGSIIPAKQSSDDAKLYVNDSASTRPAKYRVKFEKGDPIPANLKELEDMFVRAFQEEEAEAAAETYNADDNNFVFTVEEDEPEEVAEEVAAPAVATAAPKTPKKGGAADKLAQKLNELKSQNAEVQTVTEIGPGSEPVGPDRIPVTAEE